MKRNDLCRIIEHYYMNSPPNWTINSFIDRRKQYTLNRRLKLNEIGDIYFNDLVDEDFYWWHNYESVFRSNTQKIDASVIMEKFNIKFHTCPCDCIFIHQYKLTGVCNETYDKL